MYCDDRHASTTHELFFSLFRYGLLGASGSGKTTLLRCVLGRLPIHSGHINILGKPPGSPGHTVPGRDVGYMPQVCFCYQYSVLKIASTKRFVFSTCSIPHVLVGASGRIDWMSLMANALFF